LWREREREKRGKIKQVFVFTRSSLNKITPFSL
jgi:hypothetical protein